MNIGQSVKLLRKNRNHTQGEFCKVIGITQSYLSLIEGGKKKPSLEVLQKVSENLGIPLPVLFWFGIESKDVSEERQFAYKTLKPSIDNLITELFC